MTVAASRAEFVPVRACWICDSAELTPVHELIFDLSEYASQDPDLADYTHRRLALNACGRCGFAQPAALPALPRYFDRMYDQRWSDEWIRSEFEERYKDYIFEGILRSLGRRLPSTRRRLLDVGAHAGRFISMAGDAGWAAEGLELNPRTAAYAAERTRRPIRQLNVHDVDAGTAAFDAICLTDVLEHIPDPVRVLVRIAELLAPGGWVSVKVPCGPSQLFKERWRSRLRPGYRATVADNLVHVSHFSPASLRRGLERAGFTDVAIQVAAPELPPVVGTRGALGRAGRLTLYHLARLLPLAIDSPLTLHLQAFGKRESH